jgi:hypothetical protein
MRFQVLTAASMNIRAFCDVALCRLVSDVHTASNLMVAVRKSETSVYSNETTWRYILEDSNLHKVK